jgi:hypothetical protein
VLPLALSHYRLSSVPASLFCGLLLVKPYRFVTADQLFLLTLSISKTKKKNRRRPDGRNDFYLSGAHAIGSAASRADDKPITESADIAMAEIGFIYPLQERSNASKHTALNHR